MGKTLEWDYDVAVMADDCIAITRGADLARKHNAPMLVTIYKDGSASIGGPPRGDGRDIGPLGGAILRLLVRPPKR